MPKKTFRKNSGDFVRESPRAKKPKKRGNPYTRQTMQALRGRGLVPFVVEHWDAHVRRPGGGFGVRRDLLGFIDILAMDTNVSTPQMIGVQSTSGSQFLDHVRKLVIERREVVALWLRNGGKVELYGWRQLKAPEDPEADCHGLVWRPRVKVFTLEDLELFG